MLGLVGYSWHVAVAFLLSLVYTATGVWIITNYNYKPTLCDFKVIVIYTVNSIANNHLIMTHGWNTKGWYQTMNGKQCDGWAQRHSFSVCNHIYIDACFCNWWLKSSKPINRKATYWFRYHSQTSLSKHCQQRCVNITGLQVIRLKSYNLAEITLHNYRAAGFSKKKTPKAFWAFGGNIHHCCDT